MSEKVTNLIEEVKALTVLELSELVKALEEELGDVYKRQLLLRKRRPSLTLS